MSQLPSKNNILLPVEIIEEILWYSQDWLLSCAVFQRIDGVGEGMRLPPLAKQLTAVNQVIICDATDVMALLAEQVQAGLFPPAEFDEQLTHEAIKLVGKHDQLQMCKTLLDLSAKFRASLPMVLGESLRFHRTGVTNLLLYHSHLLVRKHISPQAYANLFRDSIIWACRANDVDLLNRIGEMGLHIPYVPEFVYEAWKVGAWEVLSFLTTCTTGGWGRIDIWYDAEETDRIQVAGEQARSVLPVPEAYKDWYSKHGSRMLIFKRRKRKDYKQYLRRRVNRR